MLEANLKKIQVFNEEILAQPFDFNRKEEINLDFAEMDYAKNNNDLKDRWRKILKYETMDRLYRKSKAQEKWVKKESVKAWKNWRPKHATK
jgi:carboxyl-terminal processing protease